MAVLSAVKKIPDVETQTASLVGSAGAQVASTQKKPTTPLAVLQQSKTSEPASKVGRATKKSVSPAAKTIDIDSLWSAQQGRVDGAVDKVKEVGNGIIQSAAAAIQNWAEPLGKGALNPTTPAAVWGSQQAGAGGTTNAEKVNALNTSISDTIKSGAGKVIKGGPISTVTPSAEAGVKLAGDIDKVAEVVDKANSVGTGIIQTGISVIRNLTETLGKGPYNATTPVSVQGVWQASAGGISNAEKVDMINDGVSGTIQNIGQNLIDTLGRGPFNASTPVAVQETRQASTRGTSNAEKVDMINDAIGDTANSAGTTLMKGGPLSESTPASVWAAQMARDGGTSNADIASNTAAQTGRILPAAVKSTVNAVAGTAAIIRDAGTDIGGSVAAFGDYLNDGVAQGSLNPTSSPMAAYAKNQFVETGISSSDFVSLEDMAAQAKAPIDTWVSENVPVSETQFAEFAATVFETAGAALPAMAVTYATGGAGSILTGTWPGYTAAGMIAGGTDMLEGSGDYKTAAIKAGTSIASEAVGGLLFGDLLVGEGVEEIIDGTAFSLITGEPYTLSDAAYDGGMGILVGGLFKGAGGITNAIGKEVGTQRTVSDIKAGKGEGVVKGLAQSLEIAQANPEVYGGDARALAVSAIESTFDTATFKNYVESAVAKAQAKAEKSGKTVPATVEVPSNIDNIDARNIGSYHTLYDESASNPLWGMHNAASILEASQVGKGLSPRQSGEILKATLETNSDLFTKLGQVEGGSVDRTNTVQIELGADYRDALPTTGSVDNYAVTEIQGRQAQVSEGDVPVNVFRGTSSEWAIPTWASGEFTVPNATPMALDTASIFPTGAGQMLGAGLYTTSVPSKADQYGSGVTNEISIKGSDSKGIMKYAPIFGGETFINEAALNEAKQGIQNDTVRMGRSGQEKALAEFMNSSQGNSEAAVIYSKKGDDYTEIVRPDASKTQIKNLYMPTAASQYTGGIRLATESDVNQITVESGQAQTETAKAQQAADQSVPGAAELGRVQADAASIENSNMAGNADVNALLEKNIPAEISLKPNFASEAARGSVDDEEAEPALETTANIALEAAVDSFADAVEGRSSALESAAEISDTATESVVSNTLPEIALMSVSETSSDEATTSDNASDNSLSVPEVSAAADTPVDVNVSVMESVSTRAEETTPEITTEVKDSPTSAIEAQTQASGEFAAEELSSEERASEIWTPSKFMSDKATENRRKRRERELPANDFGITKGPGSRGLIDETSGYKTTFGGLSSF